MIVNDLKEALLSAMAQTKLITFRYVVSVGLVGAPNILRAANIHILHLFGPKVSVQHSHRFCTQNGALVKKLYKIIKT